MFSKTSLALSLTLSYQRLINTGVLASLSSQTRFFQALIRLTLYSIFIFSSCTNEISRKELKKFEVDSKIIRFEEELFHMDQDTLSRAVREFDESLTDFFEIYNYYIINIGNINERSFERYLLDFINDHQNQEVFAEVMRVFPDLSSLEDEFDGAFRLFKYYFPQERVPELVSYIGGFNYPTFTVGDYIGIGLDMYLGIENEFYIRLGLPDYQKKNLYPEKIPSDALYNWLNEKFVFNDSVENLLSYLVHEGKLMYMIDKLLPNQDMGIKMGYTPEELSWVKHNEKQMWFYLIENKLLYSSDIMEIRKLIGPAPYTAYFTNESPGRATVWNGYRIVSEFASRNPELSLRDIMMNTSYQEILRDSRYNP
ncbi:MAG: hypothetical protein K9H12_01395 [Bacteroidales bacterium]|nr:hypothetical protein [Bacteroidales bacterium]